MAELIPQGRTAQTYKEAQACYERAVAILEHKRGGTILPSEAAALYYGFIILGKDQDSEGLGCVWDDVCEAGKLATSGYGVKQGSVRPITAPMTPED